MKVSMMSSLLGSRSTLPSQIYRSPLSDRRSGGSDPSEGVTNGDSEADDFDRGRKDPTWKYTVLPNEADTNTHKCVFCGKVTYGGISRQKKHLIGTTKKKKNVALCMKVPRDVKDELKSYQEGVIEKRKQQNVIDFILAFDEEEMEDNEVQMAQSKRKGKAIVTASSKDSNVPQIPLSRKRGPMDAFVHLHQEKEMAKDEKSKKLSQAVIPEAFNKERGMRHGKTLHVGSTK